MVGTEAGRARETTLCTVRTRVSGLVHLQDCCSTRCDHNCDQIASAFNLMVGRGQSAVSTRVPRELERGSVLFMYAGGLPNLPQTAF